MGNDYHAELTEIDSAISQLESKLANADSEHQRDIEARKRRHRKSKERMNSSLAHLRSARDALLEGDESDHDLQESPVSQDSRPESETKPDVPSSGDADDGLKPKLNGGFSIRHEIKKLFPELDPWRDVLQGEITSALRNRFPQRSESIQAATVSSALRRLANAGDLVLVSKGSGSEPNRYRLPGYEDENGNQEELSELKE